MPARKRSASSEDEYETKPEMKPSPGKKPKVKKEPVEGKVMGTWTAAEQKILFENVFPKAKGVKWEAVAEQIPGRDAKSCQNALVTLEKKLKAVFG